MNIIKFEYFKNKQFTKVQEEEIRHITFNLLKRYLLEGITLIITLRDYSLNQYSVSLDDYKIKKYKIELPLRYFLDGLNHEIRHIKDTISERFAFNLQKYKNSTSSIVMFRSIRTFWDIKIIDKDNPNYDRIKSCKLKNITKLFDMKKKDSTKMREILKKVDFGNLTFPQIYNLAKEIKIILQE